MTYSDKDTSAMTKLSSSQEMEKSEYMRRFGIRNLEIPKSRSKRLRSGRRELSPRVSQR